jgi:hypothetical protein
MKLAFASAYRFALVAEEVQEPQEALLVEEPMDRGL